MARRDDLPSAPEAAQEPSRRGVRDRKGAQSRVRHRVVPRHRTQVGPGAGRVIEDVGVVGVLLVRVVEEGRCGDERAPVVFELEEL